VLRRCGLGRTEVGVRPDRGWCDRERTLPGVGLRINPGAGEPEIEVALLLAAAPAGAPRETGARPGPIKRAIAAAGEADADAPLAALAELFTAGVAIDWGRVLAGTHAHTLMLPTYPFQRARYWLDARRDGPPAAAAQPAAPAAQPATSAAAAAAVRAWGRIVAPPPPAATP
jgi:hypothetical protein